MAKRRNKRYNFSWWLQANLKNKTDCVGAHPLDIGWAH